MLADTVVTTRVDTAVVQLDAWLETMRGPGGYGGPVAHWWQQSLMYTGPGLDWRYEGIIAGYLHLWERTGDERWLGKACRAGDDLVAGQLPNGHYPASSFEINPAAGGTPHEAACDVGLLMLVLALRTAGRSGWERYANSAERNLCSYYLGQLWDTETRSFRDSVAAPYFVPNKAATASEALFLLAEVTGDAQWVERYALPTLDRVLEHQILGGDRLDGAIAQNSFGGRRLEKYFPLYVARCLPALVRGYRWTGEERYIDRALRAARFIARWVDVDGSLPTVIYPNARAGRHPSWVAPLGDILRATDELRPLGFDADLNAVEGRLLAGQDESGGMQTARGFAAQVGGKPSEVPDFRDVLHVAGWCDKAFRYLASRADPVVPVGSSGRFETECTFRGRVFRLVETPATLEVSSRSGVRYRWCKGETWPEVATEEFWLR